MSLRYRTEDNAGTALVQVQDDLRQLKRDLQKLNDTELGKTLNLEELETAIHNTEHEIKKRAEDELLVPPNTEDSSKTRGLLPKWEPQLKCFPDLRPQKICQARSLYAKSKLCSLSFPVGRIQTSEDAKAGGHQSGRHKEASLPFGEDLKSSKIGIKNFEFRCPRPLQCETEPIPSPSAAKTPPPSITSKSTAHTDRESVSKVLSEEPPENTSKLTFTIKLGHIKASENDFCVFMKSFSLCRSRVDHALKHLCQLLQAYAVPVAVVKGEQLVELAYSWDSEWRGTLPISSLLSALHNQDDVLKVLSRPGQRFKGEGGTEAAAVHIQSCWRRFTARSAYLRYCRRKWAVGSISLSWLMRAQMCRVRKALQARRFSQLENQRCRAQHLAANWNHIQASKRTIIHVPSLGYSENQRRSLRDFDVLQNIQLGRLCEIRDEIIDVIYVCPLRLNEDVTQYYSSLLKRNRPQEEGTAGAPENSLSKRRFIILTPEAVDYFPSHSMCLSSLLKYSPRTLTRIRHLIQGKRAYIVPGVAHVDDLAVADELGVPLMGPEPAVAQLYGTKSGARRIFREAGVEIPPGAEDVYSLDQLHECLAELMVQNLNVTRWLFKMDSEVEGTALCDVSHMKSFSWALSQYQRYGPDAWRSKGIQEPVVLRFLKEIPQWLSSHAHPTKTSQHSTWTGFLQTYLRQGGVVEAYPPSDSVYCVTVDLLLEPGGQISTLSCGDQLRSPCGLKVLGSCVPQRSLCPETVQSLCARVGQACLQKGIIGHMSVVLASFTLCASKQHKVWALDLHLSYSDHLAMTQILLHNSQGMLSCQNSIDVPMPNTEKSAQMHCAAKRYAVLSSKLFHANLSMLYRSVFFQMCKVRGIGFNPQKKQGTLFALFDSSERRRIGMIAVSESPEGALVTFAHNLSVIHQEISSSRTQGETNFKELIKDIEDFLQNKQRGVVSNNT
ncbi:IQ motif-containing protein H [Eucyclogobius newberryi]|uniref:IQ motif-containing protein H n=1 Tax=Eucyclogobius newberryi TaxID=166745 RepID=UPI003B59EE4A